MAKQQKGLTAQQKAETIEHGTLPEWNGMKKGSKTKTGCEIVRIHRDKDGIVGHNVMLTIKCLESGKQFDIHAQDAFQVKYHPDIRRQKQLERRRELRQLKKAQSSK